MLPKDPRPFLARRELAKQIMQVAKHFCEHTGLKPPLLLVGGTDVEDSFRQFSQEGA
jgi:superfamily II DNA/RNA helicase